MLDQDQDPHKMNADPELRRRYNNITMLGIWIRIQKKGWILIHINEGEYATLSTVMICFFFC